MSVRRAGVNARLNLTLSYTDPVTAYGIGCWFYITTANVAKPIISLKSTSGIGSIELSTTTSSTIMLVQTHTLGMFSMTSTATYTPNTWHFIFTSSAANGSYRDVWLDKVDIRNSSTGIGFTGNFLNFEIFGPGGSFGGHQILIADAFAHLELFPSLTIKDRKYVDALADGVASPMSPTQFLVNTRLFPIAYQPLRSKSYFDIADGGTMTETSGGALTDSALHPFTVGMG